MTALRRLAYAVFGVACTHLVFGAIVRISGSGMGCGPHWPKCYGYWFPPFDQPDLVIEVLHRYLAAVLLLSLAALTLAAWRRRGEPGVGGRGGVLRMAALATALGVGAAVLGAVTVKLANSAPATVAHWTVAMSLVAAVTATVIRAGGLGGATARAGGVAAKTRRATFAAAAMALAAVVMGGLTAKVQGGPIACLAFPLCGANPAVPRGAVHVQSTHRVIAVLLVLHLVGLWFALRKRGEVSVVRRAATIALGLGVLQLLVAGAMIGMHLPPVLRSLHEATGVSIWIATFVLAYLARLGSDATGTTDTADRVAPPILPLAVDAGAAAAARAGTGPRQALARAMAEPPVPTVATVAGDVVASLARTPAASLPVVSAIATPRTAPVERAPARRLADEPIELPAALAHAGRVAGQSALAFHTVGACVAAAIVAAPAPAAPDATEIHYADVVDVEMLEVVTDAGAMPERPAPAADRRPSPVAIVDRTVSDPMLLAATLSAEARLVAPAAIEAIAASGEVAEVPPVGSTAVGAEPAEPVATAVGPDTDDAVDVPPVAGVVADVAPIPTIIADIAPIASVAADVAPDAFVAVGVIPMAMTPVDVAPDAADVADVAPIAFVAVDVAPDAVAVVEDPPVAVVRSEEPWGGPPAGEDTVAASPAAHHEAARVTIFDVAADDANDESLYNLRGLDPDADDADDDVATVEDDVPSLDEEFSRLTLEAAEPPALAVAQPAAVALVPVAAPLTSLAAIAALRRPAITHSVAVIVARGADL